MARELPPDCAKQGDVLIQNATLHAWANRSAEPCRVLFVLVDGRKTLKERRT